MKIAHITMSFFPAAGGQEAYIIELNKILNDAGHEISVIQPRRPFSGKKPKNVIFTPHSRFIHRLGTGFDWFWFNFMLLFYKKFLNSQDILICHYPFHLPSIKWHKNIIVLSHGVDWPNNPKILFDKLKLKNAKISFESNLKIVANDTDFAERHGKIFTKEPFFFQSYKNLWVIPNCVDTEKFNYSDEIKNNIVLLPRNIRKSRGIDLAIKAFNIFQKKHQDYKMLIAGMPLKGDYYNTCTKLIKENDLIDKVIFIGHQNQNDLIELYKTSKITLIPSTAYEGTSLSALESMACRTPVVSTKVGGLKDLPSFKSDVNEFDLSKSMNYVEENWQLESKRQFNETREKFNLINWKNAWLNVLDSPAENK
tara:strand:- start:1921 stop:3021 length:1101 start_codon:yes stop_codon:yes gene_type:complete